MFTGGGCIEHGNGITRICEMTVTAHDVKWEALWLVTLSMKFEVILIRGCLVSSLAFFWKPALQEAPQLLLLNRLRTVVSAAQYIP